MRYRLSDSSQISSVDINKSMTASGVDKFDIPYVCPEMGFGGHGPAMFGQRWTEASSLVCKKAMTPGTLNREQH